MVVVDGGLTKTVLGSGRMAPTGEQLRAKAAAQADMLMERLETGGRPEDEIVVVRRGAECDRLNAEMSRRLRGCMELGASWAWVRHAQVQADEREWW